METITIPKQEYNKLKKKAQLDDELLKKLAKSLEEIKQGKFKMFQKSQKTEHRVNPNLYEELKNVPRHKRKEERLRLLRKRAIEFEENVKKGRVYTLKDLGF